MGYKKKIGSHEIETSISGTGTFSPWQSEILHRYGIGAMCTADMAEFMMFDGAIYRLHYGGQRHIYDLMETLSELYDEGHVDEVEKELQEFLNSRYVEKYWDSLHDWIVSWGLEATEVIDEIFAMYDKYHDDPAKMKEHAVPDLETIQNAAHLYGHLVSYGCYLPDFDLIYTTSWGTVVYEIPLPYEGKSFLSLEIGKNKFGFFTCFEHGINYELDSAEINNTNIKNYLYPFLRKTQEKRDEYKKSLDKMMERNYKKHPEGRGVDLDNEEETTI